jgi:hypothetical protein
MVWRVGPYANERDEPFSMLVWPLKERLAPGVVFGDRLVAGQAP